MKNPQINTNNLTDPHLIPFIKTRATKQFLTKSELEGYFLHPMSKVRICQMVDIYTILKKDCYIINFVFVDKIIVGRCGSVKLSIGS
jgi:hypothetical protein